MLADAKEGEVHRSDGSTGKTDRATVLLADCHTEYTGDWPKRFGRWPDDYAYMHEINISAIEEAHEAITGGRIWENKDEDKWMEVWDFLFPGLQEELSMSPLNNFAALWVVEGDVEGHLLVFSDLLAKLDVVPSGDDDFFDYWPNTMDMLWQYAVDLDTWQDRVNPELVGIDGPATTQQNRVHELFGKVWDAVGAERDYRDEWLGRAWSGASQEV